MFRCSTKQMAVFLSATSTKTDGCIYFFAPKKSRSNFQRTLFSNAIGRGLISDVIFLVNLLRLFRFRLVSLILRICSLGPSRYLYNWPGLELKGSQFKQGENCLDQIKNHKSLFLSFKTRKSYI